MPTEVPANDMGLTRAREAKDFAAIDAVRDGLIALGIEVRDSPDGVAWERPAP